MSGIDEQNKVPQCPKCNESHEIYVGSGTFMFPENARIRRGLKYILFSSYRIGNKTLPEFYEDRISCVLCGTYHNNNTRYYNRLKSLFDECVARKEYYKDGEFYKDDVKDVWDADGNFMME